MFNFNKFVKTLPSKSKETLCKVFVERSKVLFGSKPEVKKLIIRSDLF